MITSNRGISRRLSTEIVKIVLDNNSSIEWSDKKDTPFSKINALEEAMVIL